MLNIQGYEVVFDPFERFPTTIEVRKTNSNKKQVYEATVINVRKIALAALAFFAAALTLAVKTAITVSIPATALCAGAFVLYVLADCIYLQFRQGKKPPGGDDDDDSGQQAAQGMNFSRPMALADQEEWDARVEQERGHFATTRTAPMEACHFDSDDLAGDSDRGSSEPALGGRAVRFGSGQFALHTNLLVRNGILDVEQMDDVEADMSGGIGMAASLTQANLDRLSDEDEQPLVRPRSLSRASSAASVVTNGEDDVFVDSRELPVDYGQGN